MAGPIADTAASGLFHPATWPREALVNVAMMAALAATALTAAALDEAFVITLATKVAILGLAGVGLNLALGTGGMISLGHAAFFGTGGYVVGVLAHHAQTYQPMFTWPFLFEGSTQMLLMWPLALLIGGLLALVIGALCLRSSGVYFIMITLAFAQMIYYFAISWPAYGGEDGLPIYVRNGFPGLETTDPLTFFFICFGLLAAVMVFIARLTASRFGMALSCARQSETRLVAVGIAPYPVRLVAFAISGAITALGGALFADLNRFVSPEMLSWHTSGELVVFVILGGVGRLGGPVAGAGLYILLEHLLGGVTDYWKALLGILLVLVVLYGRGGLMQVLAGERRHG